MLRFQKSWLSKFTDFEVSSFQKLQFSNDITQTTHISSQVRPHRNKLILWAILTLTQSSFKKLIIWVTHVVIQFSYILLIFECVCHGADISH